MMFKNRFFIITAFIITSFVLSSCSAFSGHEKATAETPTATVAPKPKPKMMYGINVDSLNVIHGKVKRNQNLSDILLKYGVDYKIIDYIARHTRDTFDVRAMRKGQEYAVICTKDSTPKPLYFVYEQSPTDYVRYKLYDTISAELGQKPIESKLANSVGVIKTSFWNAIQDNDDDIALAVRLSEIYAWNIDFFELKPDDKYKVIYRKLYVDGKYVGLGQILASDFIHDGKDYYAFDFEQDGKWAYFDETGRSLQRAFLKAPLKYTRISSHFSNRRWEPILKIFRPHHGVDYAAPMGTPVHALGDGIISAKGYQKMGGGNYIRIRHNGIYTTQYAHLSRFAKGIKVGVHVKQDQVIGYVGMTGLATGPHLDFRVFKDGIAINPLKLKSPSSIPILRANKPAYDSLVRKYMPMLDSL
ncbi:MAG: peptidoglycan DD-metalloendopeptidase family protein [Bacteroidales bacterium]|nr:peptidoglycan DD-metalloendopeptidase family protein [Bacteroidales bacterium]